ncbi:amino acid/polyamine transporter I [Podospora australis]|uniref:Amino acid/polyamine transporter I n=1 Tax=Podospora australis TaxID=1536484 RepID=A0AAN6WKM8_9PEZI|nr:amino acid/polyamine transporter I [Podospora australis]
MTPLLNEGTAMNEDHEIQTLSRDQLQERIQQYNAERQRFDVAPTRKQLLSPFTVFCLVINRTIASGIFTQPVNVLRFTGSSGVSLLIWVAGGGIIICVVATWIELALTIPIHYIFREGNWQRVSSPRNGGDKNYLEYIFKKPRDLMKCVFGITFIIWGNLAGNALQFGVFVQRAIHPTCDENDKSCFNQGYVVAWGVFILTICALFNIATRKYTMGLNNLFAVAKLSFVAVITFLGIGYGATHGDGCRSISWAPVNSSEKGSLGDISLALFFAMYPYTGYEQPFYVLAEVSRPQQTFAKATTYAMLLVLVLFPLANVSYLCMNPYTGNENLPENMMIAFIERLSGEHNSPTAVRTVSVILAIFIFGNLMAQTYTASRVKQEIAKEGILPWSLVFATGNDTLFSRIGRKRSGGKGAGKVPHPYGQGEDTSTSAIRNLDEHHEQAPFAATALHYVFEIILLLAVGLTMDVPSQAYGGLTYVYTFVIVGILGLFTAGGLLYLKVDSWVRGPAKSRKWRMKSVWQPWLDPLPAVVATLSLAFLVIAAFVPPDQRKRTGWPSWVGPTVGWGSVALGVVWWCGVQFVQWAGRWELQTQRLPVVEIDEDGQAIQKAELVEHVKVPVEGRVRRR